MEEKIKKRPVLIVMSVFAIMAGCGDRVVMPYFDEGQTTGRERRGFLK